MKQIVQIYIARLRNPIILLVIYMCNTEKSVRMTNYETVNVCGISVTSHTYYKIILEKIYSPV